MLELSHLKFFYMVAKQEGFTKAARVLRVQQPAVSRMVRQLEEQLGHAVLRRTTRGVQLTALGEAVFAHCQEIFDRVAAIEDLATRANRVDEGPLRIAASDVIATYWLPPVLKRFLLAQPGLRPSLYTGTSSAIVEELLHDRVEFGIFFTALKNPSLVTEDLVSVRFRLVGAVKRAAQADERLIASRDVDYSRSRSYPVIEMLRQHRIAMDVWMASNNLDTQLQMVKQGLGLALLPAFMVDDAIAARELSWLHRTIPFAYSMKLAHRRGKVLSQPALHLITAIKGTISER